MTFLSEIHLSTESTETVILTRIVPLMVTSMSVTTARAGESGGWYLVSNTFSKQGNVSQGSVTLLPHVGESVPFRNK